MARFQAQTNSVLEDELDEVRERLGLEEHQKAELLRELAALASWLIEQAAAGREIQALGRDGIFPCRHATLDRVRMESRASPTGARLELSDAEVTRLADVLEGGFQPTDELRDSLRRLADRDRQAPDITWREEPT